MVDNHSLKKIKHCIRACSTYLQLLQGIWAVIPHLLELPRTNVFRKKQPIIPTPATVRCHQEILSAARQIRSLHEIIMPTAESQEKCNLLVSIFLANCSTYLFCREQSDTVTWLQAQGQRYRKHSYPQLILARTGSKSRKSEDHSL